MSRVKYFINSREPGATDLAEQMRQAGIDFSSLPTSGPLVLWIDGRACYGVTAVKYAVDRLCRGDDMNAAETRKLTEAATEERQLRETTARAAADAEWLGASEGRQLRETAARAAEDAEWLAYGISDIKQAIQYTAKAERRFYKKICNVCPDFVVEHFEGLGFEVTVTPSGSIYGNLELTIRW
jgi:hypothetical protein